MQIKTCSKCKIEKPIIDFFKHHGRLYGVGSNCKACQSVRYKKYMKTEAYKDSRKRYFAGKGHKKNKLNADRRYYDKFPEKRKALNKLDYAVKTGRVIKTACEVCGKIKVQGHHNWGYEGENALRVMWLCLPHHRNQHLIMKNYEA